LKTPQGTQKIISLIDCTGSGDVYMTQTEKLVGLSGRTLKVPQAWIDMVSYTGILHLECVKEMVCGFKKS
jgi:hypothetical protein